MSQWISLREIIAILVIVVVVNVVGLWAIDFFQTEIPLVGHRGAVVGIVFVDRQQVVATACSDGKLRLFSTRNGNSVREITGHSDRLTDVTSYLGAEDVATASADGTIKIWKVPEGIQRRSIAAHTGVVLAAKYSDDGTVLVSIGTDRTIRIWNPTSGERTREVVVYYDLKCLAVNSTGTMAATNGRENETVIWSLRTGKELQRVVGQDGATVALSFSHAGNRIVIVSDDRMLRVVDANSGTLMCQSEVKDCRMNSVHFTADDTLVVGAMSDGMVGIWDSNSGVLQRSFRADQNEVLCVAHSSQQLIATGNLGRSARLWRL